MHVRKKYLVKILKYEYKNLVLLNALMNMSIIIYILMTNKNNNLQRKSFLKKFGTWI